MLCFAKADRELTRGNQLLKLTSSHCKRVYQLRGIDDVPANKAMFFDRKADDGAGRERSVTSWFQEHSIA
jgi:hypothetical protein